MSLEEALIENTAAVKALTAAMKGGAATTTAAKSTTANKPPAGNKAKHTVEDACAMIQRLNDEHSKEIARGVLKAAGFAKMSEITAAGADKVVNLANKKFAELEAGADEGDEGDDDGI